MYVYCEVPSVLGFGFQMSKAKSTPRFGTTLLITNYTGFRLRVRFETLHCTSFPFQHFYSERAARLHCTGISDDEALRDLVSEVSWNVAGLRSLLEKRSDRLVELLQTEEPRVVGLIEHKLQVDLLRITGE